MKQVLNRLVVPIIIIAAVLIICIPFVKPGFIVTDDGHWMIIRLSAFFQSFRDGQFPVRFLGRLNNNFGYPVSNFLYPGYLYIGSIIHAAGIPFTTTVELLFISSVLFGAIATYFYLRKLFGSESGFIGSMLFMLNPYLLYSMFVRGSVGEILAIGVTAGVLWAIETGNRIAISLFAGLLFISHNTMALMLSPFVFGYILFRKKYRYILPFLLGLGSASFFLIPAYFERRYVMFDSIIVSNPLEYFSASQNIIFMLIPFLIIFLMSMSRKKSDDQTGRSYMAAVMIFAFMLASELTEVIWNIRGFSKFVQFPYRFLALTCFAGPWFAAYFRKTSENTYAKPVLAATLGVCLLLSLRYLTTDSVIHPEGYFTTNEATTTVANEYMPKWSQKIPLRRASEKVEVLSGNAKFIPESINSTSMRLSVRAEEESMLRINTIYYPGWGATLDNQPIQLQYDNEEGLMTIRVPSGDHSFYMAFRETQSRFTADVISALCLIMIVVLYGLAPLLGKVFNPVSGKRKRL